MTSTVGGGEERCTPRGDNSIFEMTVMKREGVDQAENFAYAYVICELSPSSSLPPPAPIVSALRGPSGAREERGESIGKDAAVAAAHECQTFIR